MAAKEKKERRFFFQSSMPRSGSTLLQNIIAQNPDFYATPTSGVLDLIYGARKNYTDGPEFKAQDKDQMQAAFASFCKEGIKGFFDILTDKPYILDKSRGWGIHYEWLNQLFPEPKIIVMVRDMKDILCSMEKKFRAHPDKHSELVNWNTGAGATTESRMDLWLANPPVGLAHTRLRQMDREGILDKCCCIKYEDLCLYPDQQMQKIYNYLGIDHYEHDFDKIAQITKEDDEVYGLYGDHVIRETLTPTHSEAKRVLGADIVKWIQDTPILQWYHNKFRYK